MPAKRKATKAKSDAVQPDAKQAKQNGQQSVSAGKSIKVPVDEGFQDAGAAVVHIEGSDGTIYDVSLNQTNVGANNNKFYRLQILRDGDKFWCHTRWGRLGEFGQKASFGPDSFEEMKKQFDKKFKDKTGLKWENRTDEPKAKKYTYLERNYEDDSADDSDKQDDDDDDDDSSKVKSEVKDEPEEPEEPEVESKLDARIKSLVELIFNEDNLSHALQQMGYNAEKLPLGKLSKSTLLKGFEYLQALEDVINDAQTAQTKHSMTQRGAIEHFTNRYYSTIPHIGFNKRAPLPLINDLKLVKNEIDMLDNLSNMGITNEILQQTRKKKKKQGKSDADVLARVDQQFAQLQLDEATPLDAADEEYQTVQKYLVNTSSHTHNMKYKVHNIIRIDRNGEGIRFEKAYGKHASSCRRLLWHGSRTTNYGGILSQGLRIAPPEAPVSGYMFGKGIYLADISTKSANYCFGGGGSHNLIMLCEAELGDPTLQLVNADFEAGDKCKERNLLSTQGLGQTILAKWTDASRVNEQLKGVLMPDPDEQPKQNGGDKQASLQYNEYIVYDEAQVRIRYLIRFEQEYS